MNNFQVPQFIEVEDKIFGPLSFRQFVYIAGGAGLAFMLWVYIPWHFVALVLIAPVVGGALALAFYKVNNRPLVLTLEAAFRYLLAAKLYLWRRSEPKAAAPTAAAGPRAPRLAIPKLSQSKLKDLSWSLDVKETIH